MGVTQMRASRLATRAAQAGPAVHRMAASGAPGRAVREFGRVIAADLGARTPWSVQLAPVGDGLPADRDLRAALDWCRERSGGRGLLLGLPDRTARAFDPPAYGLSECDRLPVLAVEAALAATTQARPVAGLDVGPPHSRSELVGAYGGWMRDVPLARRLVVAGDLDHPGRRFLVARAGGRAVGCALVWFAAGTAYVSGLGVAPWARGRGYGGALAAAAARLGAAAPGQPAEIDTVWMYATDAGGRLYQRLGFVPVGSLVRYVPEGS